MGIFIASIGFGLVTASILSLGAVGFSMQFGITNLLNLAFGNIMTVSAYAAYLINRQGVSIWLCIPCVAIFAGVLSVLLNKYIFARYISRGTKPFGMVILTLAVSIIIQNVVLAIGGINFFSFTFSNGSTLRLGSFQLSVTQLIVIAIAVASMLSLHLLLRSTKLGKAMRATSADASLAESCGIPIRQVTDLAWLISGALCGITGVVLVMNTTTFQASTGNDFLVIIIAAAVLGGVGRPYGAMLGALIVGLVTEISAAYINPSYKDVLAFGLLVIILIVRPQGVIGSFRAQRGAA